MFLLAIYRVPPQRPLKQFFAVDFMKISSMEASKSAIFAKKSSKDQDSKGTDGSACESFKRRVPSICDILTP